MIGRVVAVTVVTVVMYDFLKFGPAVLICTGVINSPLLLYSPLLLRILIYSPLLLSTCMHIENVLI